MTTNVPGGRAPLTRPGVECFADAVEDLQAAAGRMLWTRERLDLEDQYRAGSLLTQAVYALAEIAGHLHDAAAATAFRPLRDDAGDDPITRALEAAAHAEALAELLRAAGPDASCYHAAIGHLAPADVQDADDEGAGR